MHVKVNLCQFHYYKKQFVATPRLFFRGGLKFDPPLQIARNYCSNRPAPENVFLGAGHPLTRP